MCVRMTTCNWRIPVDQSLMKGCGLWLPNFSLHQGREVCCNRWKKTPVECCWTPKQMTTFCLYAQTFSTGKHTSLCTASDSLVYFIHSIFCPQIFGICFLQLSSSLNSVAMFMPDAILNFSQASEDEMDNKGITLTFCYLLLCFRLLFDFTALLCPDMS